MEIDELEREAESRPHAREPLTYVVKRGQDVEKYLGYKLDTTYHTDEALGTCDCIGFMQGRHGVCKHLIFKGLLDQFKVDELVFFGNGLGSCKPKPQAKINEIARVVGDQLKAHFRFESLVLKRMVQNLVDPGLYNSFEFEGRRGKTTLIIGYASGVMFVVRSM